MPRGPLFLNGLLLFLLLLHASHTRAADLAIDERDAQLVDLQNSTIAKRCDNPCGYYHQLCCQTGQTCYTDANDQAQCGSGGAATTAAVPASTGGYWQYFTTTYVQTDLVTKTSVYSTWMPSTSYTPLATATAVPVQCGWGESSCGNMCCPSGQYCVVYGQCSSSGTLSAPLRPTSSGVVTVTQTTFQTTTTVPFQSPIMTGASPIASITATQAHNTSTLSGGAIAGIVIGVLLGIVLLALLCLCYCGKLAWDGFLTLIGVRRKRRRTEEVEYYSHRSSGRNERDTSRRWYGDRPARVEREKKSGGIGILPVAAGLGGLAAILGLKRDRDARRRREEKSDISSEYDSTYYTESSSDRRTRDTRRSTRR